MRVACFASALAGASASRERGLGRVLGPAPDANSAGEQYEMHEAQIFTDVQTVFSSFALHEAAPGAVAAASGKGAGADATKQPVGIQIEDKVLEKMQKDLSPACAKRYKDAMNGKGPAMHTFNQHGDVHGPTKKVPEQCEKDLQGSLCSTRALVSEKRKVADGRRMTSKIKVDGNSCLPKECTSESDLATLAVFMRAQTKEVMPGEAINVNLHVDCSKSGGGVVDTADPAAPQGRSGARAVVPALLTIAVAALALV